MKNVFLPLVLVLGISSAFGQAVPSSSPSKVYFPPTYTGGSAKLGVMTADAANAARFSFGVASNGAIFANAAQDLPTAGGKSVAINVAGSVSKSGTLAALGRFIGRAVPILSTGKALYDLANELGYEAVNDSVNLVPHFQEKSSSVVQYWTVNGNFVGHGSSLLTAAQAAYPGYTIYNPVSGACGSHGYDAGVNDGHFNIWAGFDIPGGGTCVASGSNNPVPKTNQQFLDAVAAKSGWPSTSALARVLKEAITYPGDPGATVYPQTVTGPATGEVTSTQTTTDPATGLQTVTQTAPKYSYAPSPSTVPTAQTSPVGKVEPATNYNTWTGPSIVTTNVTTNATTNTTTNTTTPGPTTEATPTPGFCDTNPNSIACATLGEAPAKESIVNTPVNVVVTPISFAANSACPSPLTFGVRGASYTVSYQPVCDRLAMLKMLFLTMAAFAAAMILTNAFKV